MSDWKTTELYDYSGNLLDVAGTNKLEPTINDIPVVSIDGTLYDTKAEGDADVIISYKSNTREFVCYAKAKVQGDSSQYYPKKNYTIKLFSDSARTKKDKYLFRDWDKARNKFVLKANWIDHSHARNIVNARLWSQVVKSRSDFNSLPTDLKKSNLAVDGFPVKVYYNGVYYGLYTWNLPKDAMYNVDSDVNENCIIQTDGLQDGEAMAFRSSTMNGKWSDEIHDEMPTVISDSWNGVLNFVFTSTDSAFTNQINSKIDLQSVIDLHICLRVMLATDMLLKNQTFFTYDAVKWYAGMYDLDATWGLPGLVRKETINWRPYNSVFQDDYGGIATYATNYLHERIWALFRSAVVSRYQELRDSVLSEGNIAGEFDKFMSVIPPYLYAEDYAETTADGAFVTIPGKTDNNILQIRDFVVDRLEYVDGTILS